MEIEIGQKAPDFILPDQTGKTHKLSDYKGQWVLIYFYPKDDTMGCTKEACMLRDNFPHFGKTNAVILGISADSVKSHAKFAEKYELPFTLLADENKEVVNLYNVWQEKKFMGRKYMGILRNSYLVNPEGKIAKIYEGVKPGDHAEEVLQDLKSLQS